MNAGGLTITAAQRTEARNRATLSRAQSRWPRRRHYDSGAVTMTMSARHGPIGRRLQSLIVSRHAVTRLRLSATGTKNHEFNMKRRDPIIQEPHRQARFSDCRLERRQSATISS